MPEAREQSYLSTQQCQRGSHAESWKWLIGYSEFCSNVLLCPSKQARQTGSEAVEEQEAESSGLNNKARSFAQFPDQTDRSDPRPTD